MTMPHLMNCDHCGDGWCSDCVESLGEENIGLREFVHRWREVIVGGDRLDSLEGWALEFTTEADALTGRD